jgi:hypothetical protein
MESKTIRLFDSLFVAPQVTDQEPSAAKQDTCLVKVTWCADATPGSAKSAPSTANAAVMMYFLNTDSLLYGK